MALWIAAKGAVPSSTWSSGLSAAEVEKLKLVEEVQQLRISNSREGGWLGALLYAIPLLTGVGAVIGGLFAVFKLLEQRKADRVSRVDHAVSEALTGLGADSERARAASAAAMIALVRQGDDVNPDLFSVATSQLRTANLAMSVATPLTRTLEQLLPAKVREHPAPGRRQAPGRLHWSGRTLPQSRRRRVDPLPVLDLDHLKKTHRFNMRRLDLRGWDVDIAYSNLKDARLESAVFGQLHGYRVCLVNAVASRSWIRRGWMKYADLTGALVHAARWDQVLLEDAVLDRTQFQDAELKQAKFSRAQLHGTNFAGADIHEADFRNTPLQNFDSHTLRTLVQAKNHSWRTAQFDEEVKRELERLDVAHTLSRTNRRSDVAPAYVQAPR